jgi:hypothetical protein
MNRIGAFWQIRLDVAANASKVQRLASADPCSFVVSGTGARVQATCAANPEDASALWVDLVSLGLGSVGQAGALGPYTGLKVIAGAAAATAEICQK